MASTKMTYRESDLFTRALGDLLQVCTLNSQPPPPGSPSLNPYGRYKKKKKIRRPQVTIQRHRCCDHFVLSLFPKKEGASDR